MNIQKISAQFATPNSKVTLDIPRGVKETALRLFQETSEVAIFVLALSPGELETMEASNPTEAATFEGHPRTFQAVLPTDPVPDNFVKYIGVLGIKNETGRFVETYILEVKE